MKLSILAFVVLQPMIITAIQITSLGSSFAAGPGIPAGKNYASLLAQQINQITPATLTDLSVSGSTLLTITSQLSKTPASSDIVTLTSGGNDLGYVAAFMMNAYSGTGISEDELVGRFESVLAKIHKKAPKAQIYLVEYLTLLGPDVKPKANVPLRASKVDSQRAIAATLQRATSRAANGKSWVVDVPVAKLSEGHGIGSAEPWVNGNTVSGGGITWHPNQAGMEAVAGILFEQIKSSGVLQS